MTIQLFDNSKYMHVFRLIPQEPTVYRNSKQKDPGSASNGDQDQENGNMGNLPFQKRQETTSLTQNPDNFS